MQATDVASRPLLYANNSLVCIDGVWRMDKEDAGLDYSDGDAQERELERLLHQAPRLDWAAPGLAGGSGDWALEYHLSPLRANILRGLDLTGRSTALEIGAGCGAITRYLGDTGFEVDAVEGSASRARLARLRCRDLTRVSVIHANIHQLRLPPQRYDLVLFIGVLEYAARFSPETSDPRKAVSKMLAQALTALAPGGVIVIAIENRLGAKYLFGSPEDHLGQPWIGLAGYPLAAKADGGICTFDAPTWTQLLEEEDLAHAFFYPLPDYKLPQALITNPGAQSPGATAVAGKYGSVSRTGTFRGTSPIKLQQFALVEAGLLPACADAFGIVAALEPGLPATLLPHDWIIFDQRGSEEAPGICLRSGQTKVRPFPDSNDNKAAPLVSGESLLYYWLRCAAAVTDCQALIAIITSHYQQVVKENITIPAHCLSVDGGGDLLEATLPWPAENQKGAADSPAGWLHQAVTDFFSYAGNDLVCFPATQALTEADLEQQVLEAIHAEGGGSTPSGLTVTAPAIYWAGSGQSFSEHRRSSVNCPLRGRQVIEFLLTETTRGIERLRFDPSNHEIVNPPQHVTLEILNAYRADNGQAIDLLAQVRSGRTPQTHDLDIVPTKGRLQLAIHGPDPWLVFDLTNLGDGDQVLLDRVELQLNWESSSP